MNITERHIQIMRHTCGMDSAAPFFRNHFVTGKDTDDFPLLEELCEMGLMVRVSPSRIMGFLSEGDYVYYCTNQGKEKIIEYSEGGSGSISKEGEFKAITLPLIKHPLTPFDDAEEESHEDRMRN